MASRRGILNELLRVRPEKGPNGGDAHCNENNPLFEFTPKEECGNTICDFLTVKSFVWWDMGVKRGVGRMNDCSYMRDLWSR